MARITFGAATSRSPLTAAPPELWGLMAERDRLSRRLRDSHGRLVSYDELLARVPAFVATQLRPEVWQAKHAAVLQAMETVTCLLSDAHPDAILFVGDDEEEYIHDDLRPAITLYRGESWRLIPRSTPPGDLIAEATNWQWGREERTYPVAFDLTAHVLSCLIEAEFDVADSLTLEAMGHGFGFLYERLLDNRVTPLVPVIINVHTPPAQPTPKRCYEFGRALRAAVESWPEDIRVAVVATGGLSVGVLEEDLDRQALDAMQQRDVDAISRLPRAWMQGSTGEVLCWVCAAGALEHLQMKLWDYIPVYRSPAGTGTGLAFATWK